MKDNITSAVHYEVVDQNQEAPRWYQELLFLIPLSGEADVLLQKEMLHIAGGDIVFVHPFQYFCISGISGVCLLYFINLSKLGDDVSPDFVMVNMYTMEVDPEFVKAHRIFPINKNPDALREQLQKIRENNRICDWGVKEFVVPEWNYDLFNQSELNDGIFQAVYIVKNAADCAQETCRFGIADPIDKYPELPLEESSFHGKRGLVTYDGMKKASYYAYKILNESGNSVVTKGDGYLITKSEREIQILLYNYQHFSNAFLNRTVKIIDSLYDAFDELVCLEFELPLCHLDKKAYLQETTIMNNRFGNVYQFYKENWEIRSLNKEDILYLNTVGQPLKKKEYLCVGEDRQVRYIRRLEPFEIRLIKLTEL